MITFVATVSSVVRSFVHRSSFVRRSSFVEVRSSKFVRRSSFVEVRSFVRSSKFVGCKVRSSFVRSSKFVRRSFVPKFGRSFVPICRSLSFVLKFPKFPSSQVPKFPCSQSSPVPKFPSSQVRCFGQRTSTSSLLACSCRAWRGVCGVCDGVRCCVVLSEYRRSSLDVVNNTTRHNAMT